MKTTPWLVSVFCAIAFTAASAQTYTWTTLAGTPDRGAFDRADGVGKGARFGYIVGLAADGNGHVIVIDVVGDDYRWRKVTAGGVVTTLPRTFGPAEFPTCIVMDGGGNMYVSLSNWTEGWIERTTPGGEVTTLPGNSRHIIGLAVDGSGNVFAKEATTTVIRITATGVVTTLPHIPDGALAADSLGNVYVAEGYLGTIRKITAAGVVTTLAGLAGDRGSADGTGTDARFNSPNSLAVDASGTVFVADYGNSTIRKITAEGIVTTLAGTAGDRGSVDGSGASARFNRPIAVAVDSSGNVFVVDEGNRTIRKITAEGVVTTLAGDAGYRSRDGPRSVARFAGPDGVTADRHGNVFVADTGNNVVRKITASGVTTVAGVAGVDGSNDGTDSAARFYGLSRLAVDGSGNVFVADKYNHTIRKITAGGLVTTFAGEAGSSGSRDGVRGAARFHFPAAVAVDDSGNVFVADAVNRTIRKITADGEVTTFAGVADPAAYRSADGRGSAARFNRPTSVTVDLSGNVFVSDSGSHTIRKITADGMVTTLAGIPDISGPNDGRGGDARFGFPCGIGTDSSGNVFVADTWNHTIRKITAGGLVTTLVGSSGYRGNADGMGTAAHFSFPSGVAVDGSGNLFVADGRGSWANHTIRKITAAGVVTTLAGVSYYAGNADGTVTASESARAAGVAVDQSGNIFVADVENHTIRKITARGFVTTLAGTAGVIGSADGTGTLARFNRPFGVAVDPSGNVYVADSGNSTIRKVTAEGIVTTLAGMAGHWGSSDGTGDGARFNEPLGVGVDGSGNVLVADTGNHTIRKITGGGVVTTVAGDAAYHSRDGVGSAARFNFPTGLATDRSGNLFVADTANHTIRKITSGGVVTTLAGAAQRAGSNDGTSGAARFNGPSGLAVDRDGNVFVADTNNETIRTITATGVVMTLGGLRGSRGSSDGTGNVARFSFPRDVAVDSRGYLFVADGLNNTIRMGVPLTIAPQALHVDVGEEARLSVAPAGGETSYQWKKDGVAIPGATSATYQISRTALRDMGSYSVSATTDFGEMVESPVAILTVATGTTSRLSNFAARGVVPPRDELSVGFVIRGQGGKSVLVRAVGPTLATLGVTGALADPKLDVTSRGASPTTLLNDDWTGAPILAAAFASVGAFALPPFSKDAALLHTLAAGDHTARVTSSVAGGSGIALTEVYDRDAGAATARLVNISTLGFVGTGAEALTLGFVIDGTASKRLLIRAIGPGLARFGVAGVLNDPLLTVVPLGKSFPVASNDNWNGDAELTGAFVSAGAFGLPLSSSNDAAVVVRLPPGGYTVTINGIAGTTGLVLAEIYDLDP